MAIKVVLDGTLFSECKIQGGNRDGMMRLSEDITKGLVEHTELEFFFANTIYNKKYKDALLAFILENYPNNYKNIFTKNPSFITNFPGWKKLTKLNHTLGLATLKQINSCNIFHSYYYPFSKSVLDSKIKKSITFLDIIPLKRKGYKNDLIGRTKEIINSIVNNYAISISEFSKQDLLNYDNRINPENVFVAPLAASQKLFYKNKNESDWLKVKSKYELPDNYFLCVAGSDPRKNVEQVIKSFSKFLLQEKPNDLYLVLTGNNGHNRDMLNTLNVPSSIKNKIIIPASFIDSNDLAVLYSNAMCFFFMSLYEGFGLPALEAMQCGTPTVVSNTTSLPEVVGNGGVLVSPTDNDALCDVMNKLFRNESLRNEYSNAGLERAATFSWKKCANDYAEIFKFIEAKV